MKITRQDGEKLVIVDLPILKSLIFLGSAAALGYHLLKVYLGGGYIEQKELIGQGISCLVFFGVGAILFQRSVFTFDLGLRQLTWSRTSLFGRRGATVPFDQIIGAVVQSSRSSKGGLSFRVALTTFGTTIPTLGATIPLTVSYSGGADIKCQEICDAINKFLGKTPVSPSQSDEAALLAIIASGDLVYAARLVSEQSHCSMDEAHRIVGGLIQQSSSGVLR